MKIMLEKTDSTHSLTMSEILEVLHEYDVEAERKSIYDDLEALRMFGLDIIKKKEQKNYSYYVANRMVDVIDFKN